MKFVICVLGGLLCGGCVGVALFGEKELGAYILTVVGLVVGIKAGLEDDDSSGGSSNNHLGCPKGHY